MGLLPAVENARTLAESAMVDTCTVYRDPEGSADDTLDVATGSLVQSTDDQEVVYEGPCLLRTAALQDRREEEGGAYVRRMLIGARIPISAPELVFGDILVVTASAHDPHLVDRTARVLDSEINTFAVTRKVQLEDQSGTRMR